MLVKLDHFPNFSRWKQKNIWNTHQVYIYIQSPQKWPYKWVPEVIHLYTFEYKYQIFALKGRKSPSWKPLFNRRQWMAPPPSLAVIAVGMSFTSSKDSHGVRPAERFLSRKKNFSYFGWFHLYNFYCFFVKFLIVRISHDSKNLCLQKRLRWWSNPASLYRLALRFEIRWRCINTWRDDWMASWCF